MTSCRVPGGLETWLAALVVLPFVACGGPGPAGDGASDSSETSADGSTTGRDPDPSSTSPVSSSESDSGSASLDDTSVDESSSTTDPLMPVCGDAHVDPGEMCDDGNLVDGDGCDIGCVPSDPGQWSYVGGPLTMLRALALAEDGSVLAVGQYGNPFAFEANVSILRALDADGELVAENDAIVPGDSYAVDVARDVGGRFWVFGGRVTNAWVYRIDGRETDQINYGETDAWNAGQFAEDLIAVSSYERVGWLDADTGDLVWSAALGVVDDSALAGDDVVVVGRSAYDQPHELRRFDADGEEQGTPIVLGDMTRCAVAASAIGTAVVCSVDGGRTQSDLRVYDDAGELSWSTVLPDTNYSSITATDDTIVVTGMDYAVCQACPTATAFAADGTESWTFLPDPGDYGLTGGSLADAELAPDGAWIFAGSLYDFATDPFEPPLHAFVIRRPP